MIVAGIFLCLIFGSSIISAKIYGVETFAGEEWWTGGIFLKFYSPSGKNYFIHHGTGEICKNFILHKLFLIKQYLFQHLKVRIPCKRRAKMGIQRILVLFL